MVGTELLDLYLASDGSEADIDEMEGTTTSGSGVTGDGSSSFGEHSTGETSSGTGSLSPAMSMARAASRTMGGAGGIGSGDSLQLGVSVHKIA